MLSRGYLTYPSEKLLKGVIIINDIFENFHGATLNRDNKIFKNVFDLSQTALNLQMICQMK